WRALPLMLGASGGCPAGRRPPAHGDHPAARLLVVRRHRPSNLMPVEIPGGYWPGAAFGPGGGGAERTPLTDRQSMRSSTTCGTWSGLEKSALAAGAAAAGLSSSNGWVGACAVEGVRFGVDVNAWCIGVASALNSGRGCMTSICSH